MSENTTPPPGDPRAPVDKILQLLQEGSIGEEHGRLRWSSNYTFLVSVCREEIQTSAIYKPQRGERPLWDFPDGTLCYREKAAFALSEALGWRIVPPTVLREGPRGLGSVQLYIEHNPEVTYFNLGESFAPQLRRIAVFDYISNNADRKGGHCLLDNQGKLWGIDHGICFHAAPKLRTVIWDFAGTPLSDELLDDINRICGELNRDNGELRQTLSKLISPKEVDAVYNRVRRLIANKHFPEPGYGPNYPWPPV